MLTVKLAEAKANLSALLDKVEHGEEIIITRHGRAVAHLKSPVAKKPLPLDQLKAFRATMPHLRRPSVRLLRDLRDEGR